MKMDTEMFLGSLLYFEDGEIQLDYLDMIRNYVEEAEEININLSKIDVSLTAHCWNEYFVLSNSKLELTEYYKENCRKIKDLFFDRLDYDQKRCFWNLLAQVNA